ncbi:SCO6880 family protein [Calidifontibacter terrae]
MSDVTTDDEVRFGQLIEPKMPGLGRLGAGASVFLVIAAAVLMILCMVNLWVGLGWAIFAMAAVAPEAFPTKDGYGRYQSIWRGHKHKAAVRSGHNLVRQGPVGHVPDGSCRLPGVAAATRLETHLDVHGHEFGLIVWEKAELYSVVIQTSPPGLSGIDKSDKDNAVAHWAAWLANLNTIEELVGASVVVETVPDSGQRLSRALDRGRATEESVPPASRVVVEQIRSSYRVGSPELSCRITLTLSARGGHEESGRSSAEMAEQIGDMLPSWTSSLDMTGAGTGARPCTAAEITDQARVAFDPSVAELVEEVRLAGESTGIDWQDAGPVYATNQRDTYVHETAFSRTWQMRQPPRGAFFAETLQSLLRPHKDISRKRVTLLFRPESPAASAAAADNEIKKATFKATSGRRAKAGAKAQLEAAEMTAKQEALGSPLIRVSMLVTVTAFDADELRRAARAVRSGLSAQARILLRLPRGSQDLAFVTALPLGLVPQVHVRAPSRTSKGELVEDVA